MSGTEGTEGTEGGGWIGWWARNSVAANLLMIVTLLGGLLQMYGMKQEIFPEFTLETVTVQVPYPGASPAEVEQGITLAVEEAVRGVDGVKKVTSVSSEGASVVSAELQLDVDPQKALADVRNVVDRVRTLPADAEDPVVALVSRSSRVIGVVLHGPVDRTVLHTLAERVRDGLVVAGAATLIDVEGLPPLELAVEIPRETLQSLGLTLDDVARQIQAGSLELPGGAIEASSGELLVRVSDRRTDVESLSNLVLRGTRGGAEVRLGDVATLRDTFADDDRATYFNGEPAVQVVAYRTGAERPIDIADKVKAFVATFDATLPEGVSAQTWTDDSERLRGRIELLSHDGMTGLLLLFLALALFLDLRLAFWVAFGIPTSVLGAFLFLPAMDVSINMISLFAFIVTLGIVADDAIVVSENFFEKRANGVPPLQAAIEGTQEIVVPVTFSVLTAGVAFSPLLFVPGFTGKIFGVLPIIVILVLFTSLVECFLILPAHLAHSRQDHRGLIGGIAWLFSLPRDRFGAALARFTAGPYTTTLKAALSWRYTTLAASFSLFLVTVGYVSSLMAFTFLPSIPSDSVRASVRLPYGVPVSQTEAVRAVLERSLETSIQEIGAADAVRGRLTLVGQGGGGGPQGGARPAGSHLLSIEVDLLPSDQRAFSSGDLEAAWARNTPPIAGVEALSFRSDIGAGGGAAVDVQISHPDNNVLAEASAEIVEALRAYPDLKNIDNGYAGGKSQLDFRLLDAARSLGLTTLDIARQLRGAFYGAEALREQRGREELKVMVRLPESQRASEHDLTQLDLRTPAGGHIPLGTVATFERGRAATSINRENGRRVVDVRAELAAGIKTARPVLDDLEANILPGLTARHPGLTWRFAGAQESQNESLASLGKNYVFALFAIYALLAIPFRSYLQPAVVMIAIPMGFVGAIGGHLLHGYEMSIISIMGIIAASGVVLNDSVVIVDAINQFRGEGMSTMEAVLAAGQRRLRPIVLNSMTTYLGLGTTLYETSVQARFLIPMAVALAYGVAFATLIALLVVPAAYLIVDDVEALGRRFRAWWDPPADDEGALAPAPTEPSAG